MAYGPSDLTAEARKLIDAKIRRGNVVDPAWVAMDIVKTHKTQFDDALHARFCPDLPRDKFKFDNGDADFYFFCARQWTRKAVIDALKHYDCKLRSEADPQLILPGYDHLQKAYTVTRKEGQRIVPIDRLTSAEIQAKAGELRAMAKGANEHADELISYDQRRGKDAAE